jgi:hypothetical protein
LLVPISDFGFIWDFGFAALHGGRSSPDFRAGAALVLLEIGDEQLGELFR